MKWHVVGQVIQLSANGKPSCMRTHLRTHKSARAHTHISSQSQFIDNTRISRRHSFVHCCQRRAHLFERETFESFRDCEYFRKLCFEYFQCFFDYVLEVLLFFFVVLKIFKCCVSLFFIFSGTENYICKVRVINQFSLKLMGFILFY